MVVDDGFGELQDKLLTGFETISTKQVIADTQFFRLCFTSSVSDGVGSEKDDTDGSNPAPVAEMHMAHGHMEQKHLPSATVSNLLKSSAVTLI